MTDFLIPFRLGLQQRVLPSYRVPLFDTLARACAGGLGVFAGQPRPEEMIEAGAVLQTARYFPANNRHFLRAPLYLCWQGGLNAWLTEWQPDALVLEANPRYLSTPGAVRWMHARHRPVIGWGLGVPEIGGRGAGLRAEARRRFLGQFDAMLAYSRQGAEGYIRAGLPPERVFVAPNAVMARPVGQSPDRPPEFAGGQPTILFVGRLQPRKRVDLLLRACAALPAGISPRLWVVGDGPARSELETLAQTIYPRAQFLGAQHGPSLDPYFLAADLFVLPGTGGLAVQQAMSFGLPVVVAQGDGTQSDLVRPANGWQIVPDNLEALIECLGTALATPARLRRMGRESYRIVCEEINLEKMVEVFAAAVHYVLNQEEK
jgi:glycosyltransferase involved in cell wall biosynthesis